MEKHELPSTDIVVRSIGRGLALSVFYLSIFGPAVPDVAGDGLLGQAIARCICLMGVICAVATCFIRSKPLEQFGYRKVIIASSVVVAILCGFFAALEVMGAIWAAVSCFLDFGLGIAVGFLIIGWACCECTRDTCSVASRCGAAFAVFGLSLIASSAFRDETFYFYLAGCVIVGMMLVLTVGRLDDNASCGDQKLPDVLNLYLPTSISYGITSMAIGFVLSCAMFVSGYGANGVFLGLVALCAVIIALVVHWTLGDARLLLGPVDRWTFPFIVAGCLALYFVTGAAYAVAASLVIVLLFVRDLSRIVTRVLLAQEYDVPRMWLCSRTAFPATTGLLFGTLLALLCQIVDAPAVHDLALAGVVTALSVAVVVTPYASDPLVMPLSVPGAPVDSEQASALDKPRLWRRACTEIREEFGLTDREAQVLEILSHGRTAAVIADMLGISIHTAKTHIYNIYHKTGFVTQQELIDQVEKRRKALKDEAESAHERM